jgi:hypothetical protein
MKNPLSRLKDRIVFWIYKSVKQLLPILEKPVRGELNRRAIEEGLRLRRLYWLRFRKNSQPILREARNGATSKPPCEHLKGGSIRSWREDYAVYLHTFLDGTVRVKCTLCPKAWYPNSPDWNDALSMVRQSTNTSSSSELVNRTESVSKGEIR